MEAEQRAAWAASKEHHHSAQTIQCQWRYRKVKTERHTERTKAATRIQAHHRRRQAMAEVHERRIKMIEYREHAQHVEKVRASISPSIVSLRFARGFP